MPAAKRVRADLLEFALPIIADIGGGEKNFKTAAKNVGRQTLRKQLGSGSREKVQAESFQQNLQNKLVSREETFKQSIFINRVELFSVPRFCSSFWKTWR